ncbi:Protein DETOXIFICATION 43 [Castilleja foliolosa]|uniref:Protein DETOXIFICATION 43 n=1 Tax=Castilleja foliolosa TaxID=1961234 RepID=A0ABD3DXE8_9LAMI
MCIDWSMGRASRPISRRSWACGAESRRDWREMVGGSTAKGEFVDDLDSGAMAILACAFIEKDYQKATAAAARVLQMGFVLGLVLTLFVGLGLQFGSGIFTKDLNVIHMIAIGIPFVAATQPINSLAFVFDGVNFGASDFAYSAYSMVLVSIVSIGSLFVLSKSNGFVGIWVALTIYMGLRTFAGFWRMGTGTGPWHFLKGRRSTPSNNI